MRPAFLRQAHRWLGLLFSLSILTSTGSGILHIVMTYTQSPPPPAQPSGGGLATERIPIPVTEAIARLPTKEARAINLRGIHGEPWYQIFTSPEDRPIYVSAIDGAHRPPRGRTLRSANSILVPGRSFGSQNRLRAEGAIRPWKVDRSALVHTCWDLGSPINTCVWFFQIVAGEIRVIDIDMDLDLTPVERVSRMLAKGYLYGSHFLPHDAMATQKSGRTFLMELEKVGLSINSAWMAPSTGL